MHIIDTPAAMRAWARIERLGGRRIGLVPTMGALHSGHINLVSATHRIADVVVVSIFVNPLQFNRRDDFDRYPRPIDDDLTMCRDAGVSAVYAPIAASMYPVGFQTHVEPGPLADPMEGAGRPGHFRGVTTVVSKLFNAVTPDVALFGQKDYQQLAIIRRMNIDLDMGVEIVEVPTVREADGLALSSRNRRLNADDRAAAVCVPRALEAARAALAGGELDSAKLVQVAERVVAAERRARLEYIQVGDAATLEQLAQVNRRAVIAAAVWFGEVRLIDNLPLIPTGVATAD